ncbi:dihydroorotate dehydrogenase electron transfer subunit, partial [bacterium]|nr:dihydroorotate dehydrogenase electron transfer subunit [bacterium]
VIRQINRFRADLFSVMLECPLIARQSKPGQFVHLQLPGIPQVLLRRPFSIAGVYKDQIKLIVRIVGAGTQGFADFQVGQDLDVLGPLGAGFQYKKLKFAYFLGGGIGAAPLLFLQDELNKKGIPSQLFIGARLQDEFPLEEEEIIQRNVIVCTDDGSYGEHGFVTQSFEKQISNGISPQSSAFSCGPVPMMREAARICKKYELPHQVSLENRMGCGIGVCQGCALKVQEEGHRGGFQLICLDGPVFDADAINWDLIEN